MQRKKIAILEDDVDYFKLMKNILEKEGYEVYGAFEGIDFIELVAKIRPNLFIADLMLPELPGDKIVKAIKETDIGHIPILFVSAKTKEEIKKTAERLNAKAWLQKPFKAEHLVGLVKKHILEYTD